MKFTIKNQIKFSKPAISVFSLSVIVANGRKTQMNGIITAIIVFFTTGNFLCSLPDLQKVNYNPNEFQNLCIIYIPNRFPNIIDQYEKP